MLQKPLIITLLLLIFSFFSNAQENNSKSRNLTFFDNLTGLESTKLYNGNRYYDLYKISEDNHNFFNSPEYIIGEVVYDNEAFYNIELKYDALKDVLVSKLNDEKSFINLELIKQKVKQFTINNHHFINVDPILKSKYLSGFAELITASDNFTFLVKRKKEMRERIKGDKLVYIFYETNTYFLYLKGEVHKIKSYKSLRKRFPDYEETINTYYESNKLLAEDNAYEFMVGLSKRLDETITNTPLKTN
jgi:hypothetical protein